MYKGNFLFRIDVQVTKIQALLLDLKKMVSLINIYLGIWNDGVYLINASLLRM